MSDTVIKAAAVINASCARVLIRVSGMQARNMQCLVKHQTPAYNEEDFLKIIEEESIGHNDVHNLLFTH